MKENVMYEGRLAFTGPPKELVSALRKAKDLGFVVDAGVEEESAIPEFPRILEGIINDSVASRFASAHGKAFAKKFAANAAILKWPEGIKGGVRDPHFHLDAKSVLFMDAHGYQAFAEKAQSTFEKAIGNVGRVSW